MLNKKALAASVTAKEIDSNFKQTVLLLHGDGTNGAQNNTFLDSSTNNFTITRNGNTTQGTFSPFSVAAGEWSNYFDGTGDYLSFANGTFNLGSNDFVIESFFYVTSSGGYYTIAGGNTDLATQTGSSWNVTINNTGTISGTAYSGSTLYQITTTATVSQNVWNHVVFVRTGGTISLFLNGTKDGTNTTLSTASINNGSTTYPPCVGANGTANVFLGYLSNTRIIIGSNSSNVYSASASSITVPTAPLTAVTDTKVLTCRSNRFVDISSSPNTVTPNGNTSVQPFSPFAPSAAYSASTNGGSGYFDGSGDNLTLPSSSNLATGSSDFTIEFWAYPTSTANSYIFSGSGATIEISSGNFNTYDGSSHTLLSGVVANQWYYIVVSRVGSTIKGFVNGVETVSWTNSGTQYTHSTGRLGEAITSGGSPFTGYISNYRLLVGTGYSSVTVPTAPPTAITNTQLLLNFTNAGITDATAKNDLETVGNAQISNGAAKFGSTSMYFDGTGDYLKLSSNVAAQALGFGTGDFTIECWVYPTTSAAANNGIYDCRYSASATGPLLYNIPSSGLYMFYNGSNRITGANPTINTWSHIALVRSSGVTKLYLNGTQTGSNYSDTNNYTSGANSGVVGAIYDGTGSFNGYIDDLRITKGIARYTANFTAPTKAFADQ